VNLDIRTDPIDALLPGAAGFAPHQAISLSLLVELMAALGGGRGREAFAGADEKRPSSGYFFAALDPSIVCADEEFVFPFEGVGAGEHGFYAAVEALVEELRNEADGNGLLPGELGYRRELAASKAGAVELTAEDAEVLLWVGQGLPTGESVDVPSFLEGAV
jgi:LDH2 family malate/lactate/ureidoglycolate dehydrogenase